MGVMKQVAKCIIVDNDGKYLILRLNNHPTFGNDFDLPGGTLDEGETLRDTVIREVKEEIGVAIKPFDLQVLYGGSDYSKNGTWYELYVYRPLERPGITLSWEHASYEWVAKEEFVTKARSARDTYMGMVAEVVLDEH